MMWEFLAVVGTAGASAMGAAYALTRRTVERDRRFVEDHNRKVASENAPTFQELVDYYTRKSQEEQKTQGTQSPDLAPPDYSGPRGHVHDISDLTPPPNPDGYGWISGRDDETKEGPK